MPSVCNLHHLAIAAHCLFLTNELINRRSCKLVLTRNYLRALSLHLVRVTRHPNPRLTNPSLFIFTALIILIDERSGDYKSTFLLEHSQMYESNQTLDLKFELEPYVFFFH